MKKTIFVLCVAALLPFAASGVYAQLKFSGSLHTGIAGFFPGGSDPTVSLWSPDEGAASRIYLRGAAFHESGNFGVNFSIQADTPFNTATYNTTSSLYYGSASGWVKFWDRRFTLIGGKLDDSGVFRTFGGIDEEDMAAKDYGFHARFENLPFAPNLTAGMTVMPGAMGQMDRSNQFGMGSYRYAVRYLFPGTIDMLGMFYDDAMTSVYGHSRLHAFLAFNVTALNSAGLDAIRADFGFYDMQDRDYFNMKTGQRIVYTNGFLEVGGRFRQSFMLGGSKEKLALYTPELLFRLYGAFSLLDGRIRPRLEAAYLYGGYQGDPAKGDPVTGPELRLDGYDTMKSHLSAVDPAAVFLYRVKGFRYDTAFLSIVPQVEFRILGGNTTAIIVGGGPLLDLSASNPGYDGFAFINLRVNF